MMDIVMYHVMLQIFRWNISANQTPWMTNSTNGNFLQAFKLVIINIPWAFPFITMVLLIATDYELFIKRGVDAKNNLFAASLVYTMTVYVEVVGGLTATGWFFLFEFITILVIYIMTLFGSNGQA